MTFSPLESSRLPHSFLPPTSLHFLSLLRPKNKTEHNEVSYIEVKIISNSSHQLLAYWVIFHDFMLSADFFQHQLFQKILSEPNSLDPDEDQHFVGPHLGQNCLQRLSADDKSCH